MKYNPSKKNNIVSIILLTKNAGKNFNRTLEKLIEQEYDGKYEIILIDSGSRDCTLDIAKKYAIQIHEIPPCKFGHGKTRNLAIELSRGAILVYLTQDAIPTNNTWLREIVKGLENHKVAGIYGRQIPKENANPMEIFFLSRFYPNKTNKEQLKINKMNNNVFFSNVNSAINKEVLKKYKFSEETFIGEDQEWANRVTNAGLKVLYNPKAIVYHSHQYTLKGVFKRFYDSGSALISIENRKSSAFIKEGLSYYLDEFKFLYNNGYRKWIPYAFIYDMIKFLGFMIGKRNKYLPISLRNRLSMYFSIKNKINKDYF